MIKQDDSGGVSDRIRLSPSQGHTVLDGNICTHCRRRCYLDESTCNRNKHITHIKGLAAHTGTATRGTTHREKVWTLQATLKHRSLKLEAIHGGDNHAQQAQYVVHIVSGYRPLQCSPRQRIVIGIRHKAEKLKDPHKNAQLYTNQKGL